MACWHECIISLKIIAKKACQRAFYLKQHFLEEAEGNEVITQPTSGEEACSVTFKRLQPFVLIKPRKTERYINLFCLFQDDMTASPPKLHVTAFSHGTLGRFYFHATTVGVRGHDYGLSMTTSTRIIAIFSVMGDTFPTSVSFFLLLAGNDLKMLRRSSPKGCWCSQGPLAHIPKQ